MQQKYVNDGWVGGNGNRGGNGGFINQCRGYDRIRTNAEKSFLHNRRPDVRRKMVIAQKAITLELGITNDMTRTVESGEITVRENKKRKVNDDDENCSKQINDEVIGKMRRNRLYVKMFYDAMEKHYLLMEKNLKQKKVNSAEILEGEQTNRMYMEMFYDVMERHSLYVENCFTKNEDK